MWQISRQLCSNYYYYYLLFTLIFGIVIDLTCSNPGMKEYNKYHKRKDLKAIRLKRLEVVKSLVVSDLLYHEQPFTICVLKLI